jgi:26S proteasome regulatory subunit N5
MKLKKKLLYKSFF